MSRVSIFFLVIVSLGLAILLAGLGWVTIASNLLGWFLLLTGSSYFFGVIIVYWFHRIRFWQARADGTIQREERNDGSFRLIVNSMIAAFYLPPLEHLFIAAFLPRGLWMQVIGLLLVFLGSALFIWARRVLGTFYAGHVSILTGQPLVQHGPYRYIRHPAYAGYILIAFGLALGYSSLIGFAAILSFLLPAVIYRIRVEERLLGEHFGVIFEDYVSMTRRLIPGIW